MRAKFVNENIGNVLKPKDSNDIFKSVNNQIKRDFYVSPDVNLYLYGDERIAYPKFYYNSHFWKPEEKKWVHENVTDEAINKIILAAKKINSNISKVKAIQTSGNQLTKFLYLVLNSKNKNIKHNKNSEIFSCEYSGKDYAFFGHREGFGLFLVPEDFINLNESMSDILAGKKPEEIAEYERILKHAKEQIEKVSPLIVAYTPSEYNEKVKQWFKNPDEDDFEQRQFMLIVMDRDPEELPEYLYNEAEPLGGTYDVTLNRDNEIVAEWTPYPEELIVGLDNFINHLKTVYEL